MALPVHDVKGADTRLRGAYYASPVRLMEYGEGSISELPRIIKLLGCLTGAVVITGRTLASKTPVITDIEGLLGHLWKGTFKEIGEHAPIADIRRAIDLVRSSGADCLISVGGGSPIDSAKVIAYELQMSTGVFIPSIAVPTTLSVAETTQNAGFTNNNGHKQAVSHPELVPKAVLYDGKVALYTPLALWLSTGIRALDHALELLYHPLASEVPTKRLCLAAIQDLFTWLPDSKTKPEDAAIRQRLLLAAYSSLFPFLYTGGVGLSHSIGHSIGATYGIPHGVTSCLSLAPTLHHKADTSPQEAEQIARALPLCVSGARMAVSNRDSAHAVADAVSSLVEQLGLKTNLTKYGVPRGEEEAIAARALKGNDHPEFATVVKLVSALY